MPPKRKLAAAPKGKSRAASVAASVVTRASSRAASVAPTAGPSRAASVVKRAMSVAPRGRRQTTVGLPTPAGTPSEGTATPTPPVVHLEVDWATALPKLEAFPIAKSKSNLLSSIRTLFTRPRPAGPDLSHLQPIAAVVNNVSPPATPDLVHAIKQVHTFLYRLRLVQATRTASAAVDNDLELELAAATMKAYLFVAIASSRFLAEGRPRDEAGKLDYTVHDDDMDRRVHAAVYDGLSGLSILYHKLARKGDPLFTADAVNPTDVPCRDALLVVERALRSTPFYGHSKVSLAPLLQLGRDLEQEVRHAAYSRDNDDDEAKKALHAKTLESIRVSAKRLHTTLIFFGQVATQVASLPLPAVPQVYATGRPKAETKVQKKERIAEAMLRPARLAFEAHYVAAYLALAMAAKLDEDGAWSTCATNDLSKCAGGMMEAGTDNVIGGLINLARGGRGHDHVVGVLNEDDWLEPKKEDADDTMDVDEEEDDDDYAEPPDTDETDNVSPRAPPLKRLLEAYEKHEELRYAVWAGMNVAGQKRRRSGDLFQSFVWEDLGKDKYDAQRRWELLGHILLGPPSTSKRNPQPLLTADDFVNMDVAHTEAYTQWEREAQEAWDARSERVVKRVKHGRTAPPPEMPATEQPDPLLSDLSLVQEADEGYDGDDSFVAAKTENGVVEMEE